jgi:hypothetical protein
MFTRSGWFGAASSAKPAKLRKRPRRMQIEGLEPRLTMAADPQAVDDIGTTVAGQEIFLDPLANDVVADTGEPLDRTTVEILTNPTRGVVEVDPETGIFHYTPGPFFTGVDTFTYHVRDTSTAGMIEEQSTIIEPASAAAPGAVWKYLDDGSNQGTAWVDPDFDDAAWESGASELGYGDGDEDTVVDCDPDPANGCRETPDANDNFITTYFRHKFQLTQLSAITDMDVFVKFDDGVLSYINGQPLARGGLAFGAPYDALAAGRPDADENVFAGIDLEPADVMQLFVEGENTMAVEIHQAAANSSDVTFDFALFIDRSVPAGRLSNIATVTINVLDPNPTAANDSAQTRQGQPVLIDVLANDAAGPSLAPLDPTSVQLVSAPANGDVVVDPVTGAVTYTSDPGFVGTDTFSYRVQDTATNNGAIHSTLVPRGATWKYLDTGANPGATWFEPQFNDASWLSGPAELGYGDGSTGVDPGGTVINCGLSAPTCDTNNIITYYFRGTFNVADPAAVDTLSVFLRRDDGAIVYINGQEAVRDNMPTGPITPATLAMGATDDGVDYTRHEISAGLLAGLLTTGQNTIAVEVHQVGATSSDVSFDLELLATEQFGQGNPSNIATVEVTVTPSTQTGCDEADLSRNFSVGNEDLALFVRNYGATAVAAGTNGDLDRNGRLGLNDLLLMRTFLGQNCGGGSPAAAPDAPVAAPGAVVEQLGPTRAIRPRLETRSLQARAVDRAVTIASDDSRPIATSDSTPASSNGSGTRMRASRRPSARPNL